MQNIENNIQNQIDPLSIDLSGAPIQPQRVKKYDFTLRGKDRIFSLFILIATVCFVTLGLFGQHLGLTLSFVLLFSVVTASLITKQTKIRPFPAVCGILAVVGSAVYSFSDDPSVNALLFLVMFILSVIWFDSLNGVRPENGELSLLANAFGATLDNAVNAMPRAVRQSVSGGKNGRSLAKALIGVGCAIPVLAIVIPLLITSDAAFEGLINFLFDDMLQSFGKIILGLIATPFALGYVFGTKYRDKSDEKTTVFKGIDRVYVISFLSVIAFIYLIYLFSQLGYFFSAFKGFMPQDYTASVSDYARRGFFEMCYIAAINFVLIYAVLLISKKDRGTPGVAEKLLSVFVAVFTLIIIATAISKMILYINEFGMTVRRITTSTFMVFLAVVFTALILRCFISSIKVVRTAVITAALLLITLGFGNIRYVAADYNYNAYINGKLETVDIETIAELGDAGVPYIVKLCEDTDKAVAKEARSRLSELIKQEYYEVSYSNNEYVLNEKKRDDFENWNLNESRAYAAIDEYIKQNPQIIDYKEGLYY